ncbi:MAG: heavy metal translocating P-type ATPase [Kofleriaceae bacterium]|nr:heavy metal translocating P-type ATPase [Kofleriaceae bacterium]
MTTSRFLVPAMDCATEKDIIANRLGKLDEVESLDFDILDRIVTVRHRPGAEVRVESSLREIGMDPRRLVDAAATLVNTRFHVPALDCATEKDIVANRLAKLPGIEVLDFDLIDRVVVVRHHAGGETAIERALREIGMAPRRVSEAGADIPPSPTARQIERPTLAGAQAWTRGGWLLGFAGALALAAEILAWTTFAEDAWPVIAMSVACIVLSGPTTFKKGLVALRTMTLNINLLMTIAVAGAITIGQWPEAAMVTFLFAVAELIEARSVERARTAIHSLMALTPETARVRRGGAWVEVAASEVAPGDSLQVRPGDRVPLDGNITSGTTAIDQAPITGESIPVEKGPGDPVYAGTINQHGTIEVAVTAGQGDTTLARIARTIREAQSQKAPTERFVDSFARWYTPAVVLLAIGVAVVPPLATGAELGPWLYKALVLLVIACPCALVISTPVTIVSGLAAAARRGILVKGGAYLEQAARLRVIALDKTGTLTEGKPELVGVEPMNGVTRDDLLRIAASLEASSTHPIAQAVVRAWQGDLLPATDARNIAGKGLEGVVDGKHVTIGSHRLAEERGVCNSEIERELARLEAGGSSVMVVWTGQQVHQVLGVLAGADVVRPSSVEAVRQLHAEGIKLAMLTGDNPTTARAVGDKVGIDEVDADLLPEDKLATIDRLIGEHGAVAMVGDGVNDAPALARATIGFAMGAAGTDTALETADVALMKDDLRAVPELVALSRQTARTLKVNIALSIGIKVVFFALALVGIATLWMAVFADMGASLLVAANGLRILGFDPRRTA